MKTALVKRQISSTSISALELPSYRTKGEKESERGVRLQSIARDGGATGLPAKPVARAWMEARAEGGGCRSGVQIADDATRVAESDDDDDGDVARVKLAQLEDLDGTIPYRATLSTKRRTCLSPSSHRVLVSLSAVGFTLPRRAERQHRLSHATEREREREREREKGGRPLNQAAKEREREREREETSPPSSVHTLPDCMEGRS